MLILQLFLICQKQARITHAIEIKNGKYIVNTKTVIFIATHTKRGGGGGQEKNCGGYTGKGWVPKVEETYFFLPLANLQIGEIILDYAERVYLQHNVLNKNTSLENILIVCTGSILILYDVIVWVFAG